MVMKGHFDREEILNIVKKPIEVGQVEFVFGPCKCFGSSRACEEAEGHLAPRMAYCSFLASVRNT